MGHFQWRWPGFAAEAAVERGTGPWNAFFIHLSESVFFRVTQLLSSKRKSIPRRLSCFLKGVLRGHSPGLREVLIPIRRSVFDCSRSQRVSLELVDLPIRKAPNILSTTGMPSSQNIYKEKCQLSVKEKGNRQLLRLPAEWHVYYIEMCACVYIHVRGMDMCVNVQKFKSWLY